MDQALNQKIDGYIAENKEQLLKDLAALVAIDSVEGEPAEGAPFGVGPRAALDKTLEIAAGMGLATRNCENYIGYAELAGADPEKYLATICHVDVVPVGNGWTVPALEMTRKDGKIFGRGVIDDKGPAVMALYAMRALKECGVPLAKNCRLILGSDEECGSSDIAWYFDRNPIPPQTLSPDASYPCICIEKGSLRVDVQGHWEKQPAEPRLLRFDCHSRGGGERILQQ